MTTITVVSANSYKVRPIILGEHREGALDMLPHNGQYGNLITMRAIDDILDRIDDRGAVVLTITEAMIVSWQGWRWACQNHVVDTGPNPIHEATHVYRCFLNPSSALAKRFIDELNEEGGDGWIRKILDIAHMNRKYKKMKEGIDKVDKQRRGD